MSFEKGGEEEEEEDESFSTSESSCTCFVVVNAEAVVGRTFFHTSAGNISSSNIDHGCIQKLILLLSSGYNHSLHASIYPAPRARLEPR